MFVYLYKELVRLKYQLPISKVEILSFQMLFWFFVCFLLTNFY